jgi:hypothetical protein
MAQRAARRLTEQQVGLDASYTVSLAYIQDHPRHMTSIKHPHMEGVTRAKLVPFSTLPGISSCL